MNKYNLPNKFLKTALPNKDSTKTFGMKKRILIFKLNSGLEKPSLDSHCHGESIKLTIPVFNNCLMQWYRVGLEIDGGEGGTLR